MAMLHIKLKRITNAWLQIFARRPPSSRLWLWGQLVKIQLSQNNQIKGNQVMQQHGKFFARRPPTTLGGWSQMVKILLFQNMVVLHNQIKWNHEMQQHGSK